MNFRICFIQNGHPLDGYVSLEKAFWRTIYYFSRESGWLVITYLKMNDDFIGLCPLWLTFVIHFCVKYMNEFIVSDV